MRMFDIYLYEGEKVLYRIGLAILKMKEKQLFNLHKFEEIMFFMKKPIDKKDEDKFITIANSFTFSKKMINVEI